MTKLVISHRLDLLAKHLTKALLDDGRGVFAPRIIVIPNSDLKGWLLMQIANMTQEKGIAGCKAMTLHEAVKTFIRPANSTEIYCSLFSLLSDYQNQELRSYLDRSPGRIVELADHLTGLFVRYGTHCPTLFDQKGGNWQNELIQTLFVSGDLRLPVQMQKMETPSIHCFGFDYLPSALLNCLNFSSIYLFSPCWHFWEDLCTDRDRKRIAHYWKKKGASKERREELDTYMKNAPSLLSNWGRVGREMLKILDPFVEEIEEGYESGDIEPESTLARLMHRILSFNVEEKGQFPGDDSIQISKTGSSLLMEVEHLRESILRLIEEKGIQCSDIAVLAPDIQPYASLIQFVFTDLPFRISGLEIGTKSFFYQGLNRFFELFGKQLDSDSEAFLVLIENPSFNKKRGWTPDISKQIHEWISNNQFEKQLLDRFIYLYPEKRNPIPCSGGEALEQWISLHQSLQSDLNSLQQSRTLSDWAKCLLTLIQTYFSIDLADEADAAAWNFFEQSMEEFKNADTKGRLFPFAALQPLWKKPIRKGQIHASHLHAIHFSSLAEGALKPVRALFLIGMSEENFPRRSFSSSLDLLRKDIPNHFDAVDQDRYLFLQALYAASECLHFSYCHLALDGNPINPSPLIDELIRNLDAPIKENKADQRLNLKNSKKLLSWPEKPIEELPQGERTVTLSDLSSLARHPWEFYLKKQFGIRFDGSDEESFSRQKRKLLRTGLQNPTNNFLEALPPGICGKAMRVDLEATLAEWADLIRTWNLSIEPISFLSCCREKKRREIGWEFPNLGLNPIPGLHVKLIGEVKTYSSKGYVHTGNDNLEGLLRAWPECLAALVASDSHEIYCLKSGKIRTVRNPEAALSAFSLYYFLSQSAPSPMLVDWADPILRDKSDEWEKKIRDKILKKGVQFEDAVSDWVFARASLPSPQLWLSGWERLLQEYFSELTAIFYIHK